MFLQCRVDKIKYFGKLDAMSEKMINFVPNWIYTKETWQERKKNFLYWKR